MNWSLSCCTVTLLAASGPAQAQVALPAAVDTAVARTMRDHAIPGLALGIVRDGKVVYTRGFGFERLGGRRVTPRTIFNLASITKTFTAAAVMQLVERGKLQLDSPVTTYVPWFRLADPRFGQITVRHLLTHRSGLRFIEENPFDRKPGHDRRALERHVRELAPLRLGNAPGAEYEYSNEGYDILGEIVAQVSGLSYERYVEEELLRPLGMTRSSVLVERGYPPRYYVDEHGRRRTNTSVPFNRAFAPSSGLDSNVDDMTAWIVASLNRGTGAGATILEPSSYDVMWNLPVTDGAAGPFPINGAMGGGWFRWSYRGHQVVGHGGAELGYNSFIALAPADGIGVVVLGNLYPAKVNYSPTGTYYTADLAKTVLDLLLPVEPR